MILTYSLNLYLGAVIFCEDLVIPKKSIYIFLNNKPWVSKSVNNIITQRNISFNQGDDTHYSELQKQVKMELKLPNLIIRTK